MISRLLVAQAVLTRLQALGVPVYHAEIGSPVPLIAVEDTVDPAGRVAKHIVFYASPGAPGVTGDDTEDDIAGRHDDLLWSCQTTLVAGWPDDLNDLADQVHAQLHRWTPTVEGHRFGRMRSPLGFDPGVARRNDQATPPRFWLPLQWQLPITA